MLESKDGFHSDLGQPDVLPEMAKNVVDTRTISRPNECAVKTETPYFAARILKGALVRARSLRSFVNKKLAQKLLAVRTRARGILRSKPLGEETLTLADSIDLQRPLLFVLRGAFLQGSCLWSQSSPDAVDHPLCS